MALTVVLLTGVIESKYPIEIVVPREVCTPIRSFADWTQITLAVVTGCVGLWPNFVATPRRLGSFAAGHRCFRYRQFLEFLGLFRDWHG